MARGALLRLCRPMSHHLRRFANNHKLINKIAVSSPFVASSTSPAQFSSSSSAARADPARPKTSAKVLAKDVPETDSETSKRLKNLAQILGNPQEDSDADLDPETFLLKVLKKELKKADKAVQKYKVEIKGSFDPFELVPTEGTSDLTLRRQMGDEEILIKCILELEEPDDEEYLLEENVDMLNIVQHLKMNIQIKKASLGDEARFQLMCHYMTHSIKIEEIVYLDKTAYVENDFPYIGPLFSDLNDTVQQSFYDLIKERGIDAKLADLALDHLSVKYQDEYIRWVQNIRRFLKKRGELKSEASSTKE